MRLRKVCFTKKNMSNKTNNPSRIKILCIHGYRQNGDMFRKKTGSFRKLLKSHVDFYFVTAPHEVINTTEPNEQGEEDDVGQRGWWFTSQDNTFNSKTHSDICVGLEKSIEVIETAFKENGPFDGLLGFSQGASFLSLLCGMQNKGDFQPKINFAILVAGFKSRCSLHDSFYESKINIPSLHIIGENDQVIPKEMSEDLLQFFQDPVVATHEGRHHVPCIKSHKQIFLDFFEAVHS